MVSQKVADVLAYTRDMMVTVIEGEWEDLTEMQIKQDGMLRDLFSVKDQLFSDEEKQELIEVQRLNQEILNIAEDNRADIAKELRGLQQGRSKAFAYQTL